MEMIKKEERKDDGRYIIFYEFDEDQDSNTTKKSSVDKSKESNLSE